ncbi:MAG: hypothetical protein ING30_12845 [Burkholderiales bacterium]|nr:hypothetical protein [Burkholderiales bacterium]
MRIALIHAGTVSIQPIENAFRRLWPEAQLMNILDDSLFSDRGEGALPAFMTDRFIALGRYAVQSGAQGILFTCSAFSPCIEACANDLAPILSVVKSFETNWRPLYRSVWPIYD